MFIYNLQEMAKALQSEYNSISSKIEHSGIKGTMREDKLKEYIKKLLPIKYTIASGCIVDSNENQSRQQDFIIYDNFNSPVFALTEKEQIIPIESVYATIEVKSTLTIDELDKSIKHIESVHNLEKSNCCTSVLFTSVYDAPLSMIFAYTSNTSLDNIVKNLDVFNNKVLPKNRVSIICVLDKGLIFPVNKFGFDKIELNPNENSLYVVHEDIVENNLYLFYLLLMTGLNNLILPPVNLMEYAKKIKKANYSGYYSSDRPMPDDAYIDIGNGLRSNLLKNRKYVEEQTPKFNKYQKGEFTKEEFIDFMATAIYPVVLDPHFTGEEHPSDNIFFFNHQISFKYIEMIYKYYKKDLKNENEIIAIEQIIDMFYELYKKETNKNNE